MVEHQLPKLRTRVRFPSSALSKKSPGHRTSTVDLRCSASEINTGPGPLAHRSGHASRTIVAVVGALPVLVNELGQAASDPLIGVTRGPLVDQRGPHIVVTHPGHEVLGGHARLGRGGLTSVDTRGEEV